MHALNISSFKGIRSIEHFLVKFKEDVIALFSTYPQK